MSAGAWGPFGRMPPGYSGFSWNARTNMARSRKKIGEVLVGWGLVTQAQLDEALGKSKSSGKRVGETLVELGFAKDDQHFTDFLARSSHVRVCDLI